MNSILDIIIECAKNFDDCFTIVDTSKEDSPLVFVNSYFEKTTGYTSEEVLNRNCRFLQGPKSSTKTISKIRTAISKHETCWFDVVNHKKDGSTFNNRLVLIPIPDDIYDFRYYVGIQCDVSTLSKDLVALDLINKYVQHPLAEVFTNLRSLNYVFDNKEKTQELKKDISNKIRDILNYVRYNE